MRPALLIPVLLAACSPKEQCPEGAPPPSATTSTHQGNASASSAAPNHSAPAPAEVPFKQLGWDGSRYTYKAPQASAPAPYTGLTTDHYKSGQLKARYGLRDGVYHGLVEEWYENGQQKTKTSYENGRHQGDNFYWNADGTLQVHKVWKDDVLLSEKPGGPD